MTVWLVGRDPIQTLLANRTELKGDLMKLEHLMTYKADLAPPQVVGKAAFGTRQIFEVTGGAFEGPNLRGEILTCGGDWLLVDDDGIGRLDVRATFLTDDGAHVFMQYFGVLELNDTANTALAQGGGTDYGDHYFMTQPRFETGDERYQWLAQTVAVAQGRIQPGAVEYEVFACRTD